MYKTICAAEDSIKQHTVCKSDIPPSLQRQVGIYNSRPCISLSERSIIWGLTNRGFYSVPKWKVLYKYEVLLLKTIV